MREPEIRIVSASDMRRTMTVAGDIRTEVEFQNDINSLLARFEEVRVPWRALSGPTPTLPPAIVSDTTPMPSPATPVRSNRIDITVPRLRVLDGGGAPVMALLPVGLPMPDEVAAPAPEAPRRAGARQPRRRA
jgi:hypothetical protein